MLPGLQDHHLHLNALAASLDSLNCGPPAVSTAEELSLALNKANEDERGRWLRGIGYHADVAGDIDREWLDTHIPDRPARIQHRGGRLWLLNSAGLAALGIGDNTKDLPQGAEKRGGQLTGRLFECDVWLRDLLRGAPPMLDKASSHLASHGVTDLTDTSPANNTEAFNHFRAEQDAGRLLQSVRMMGSLALTEASPTERLNLGEYKVHLLESQLPEKQSVCNGIKTAREQGRNIAVHCVTLAELSFTLDCFDQAGNAPGDRIEHASVVPSDMIDDLRARGLRVVTQPHFVRERGDQYLKEVSAIEQRWLYRLRTLLNAGIPLAGGSDAPFGSCNPWLAMDAAVKRTTVRGQALGTDEALSPEEALDLYTSPAEAPGLQKGGIEVGTSASLCLLQAPWASARQDLANVRVDATWHRGQLIYRSG